MCIGNNIVQHFVIFIFFHWRRSGTVSLDMEWEQDTVLLICVVGECTVIHIVLRCGTKKRCLDLKKRAYVVLAGCQAVWRSTAGQQDWIKATAKCKQTGSYTIACALILQVHLGYIIFFRPFVTQFREPHNRCLLGRMIDF